MNMNRDYMLAIVSPIIRLGDTEYNTQLILSLIDSAAERNADFLILPDDVIQGKTLGDIAYHPVMTEKISCAIEKIANKTKSVSLTVITSSLGRELFITNGKVLTESDVAPKRLPSDMLPKGAKATSDIILRNRLRSFSECIDNGLAYAVMPNIGESTGICVYDGQIAVAKKGHVIAQSKPFSDDMLFVSSRSASPSDDRMEEEAESTYLSKDIKRRTYEYERILTLQAYALLRRLDHIGCRGFVVGVSGGLDSTLALIAAVKAANIKGVNPADYVLGLSMPGFGTTNRTRKNAKLLIEVLGARFLEIDIRPACIAHFESLNMSMDFEKYDKNESLVLENAQARERTRILLSISNRDGLLDVGTGDLSEDALGFSTIGGDHLALYGINSSLPKTVIREVTAYAAKTIPGAYDVLRDILDTPVSPELLPSKDGDSPIQRTEEILGSYELHDMFILNMLKNNMTPSELYTMALDTFDFPEEYVYNTLGVFLRRFFMQQYKRNAATEGPNILFGISPTDLSMPSDVLGVEFMREYETINRRRQ